MSFEILENQKLLPSVLFEKAENLLEKAVVIVPSSDMCKVRHTWWLHVV